MTTLVTGIIEVSLNVKRKSPLNWSSRRLIVLQKQPGEISSTESVTSSRNDGISIGSIWRVRLAASFLLFFLLSSSSSSRSIGRLIGRRISPWLKRDSQFRGMRSRKCPRRATCRSRLVTSRGFPLWRRVSSAISCARSRRKNGYPFAPPFDRWIAKYARNANLRVHLPRDCTTAELDHGTSKGIEAGKKSMLLGYAGSIQWRSFFRYRNLRYYLIVRWIVSAIWTLYFPTHILYLYINIDCFFSKVETGM